MIKQICSIALLVTSVSPAHAQLNAIIKQKVDEGVKYGVESASEKAADKAVDKLFAKKKVKANGDNKSS